MINEVVLFQLIGLFGVRTGLICVASGLTIAVVAGWVIGKLRQVPLDNSIRPVYI